VQNEAEEREPADRPGASGGPEPPGLFAPSDDEHHPKSPQKVGYAGRRILLQGSRVRSNIGTPPPFRVATYSCKLPIGQPPPDEDSRSDAADDILGTQAGATMGVRPPLRRSSIPAFVRFAILSCNGPFGLLRPRPVAQGCWRLQAESGHPATPRYPAFWPLRIGHRGRPTPAPSCSAAPTSDTPRVLGTYCRQVGPMTRPSIDQTASFGTQPVSTCTLWRTNGTR
jgi:hypothetical protein